MSKHIHRGFVVLLLAVLLGGCASKTGGMILIPEGDFIMGSEKGLTDEQPAHKVFLDAFWIDKTEVTNALYAKCVAAAKCNMPTLTKFYDDPAYADHPVVAVTWVDAKNYCEWSGRRLPTEAEWEKAASWNPATGTKRIYPWGDEFDCKKGNFNGADCDPYENTAPVGSFPEGASAYGVLDMGGNAWEWVNDAFIETDPYGERQNYYATSPSSNPPGVDPAITVYRVMRGGAWKMNFGLGRSAYRLWFALDDTYDFVGFRCALSK